MKLADGVWLVVGLISTACSVPIEVTAAPVQLEPASTPAHSPAPVLLPTDPQAAQNWVRLEGVGFRLNYPADWHAHRPPAEAASSGVSYDLILSDAPGNDDPQSGTADERARLTIWHILKPPRPIEEWIAPRWAWLDTALTYATLGQAPALSAELTTVAPPLHQYFFWVEREKSLYVIEAYSRTDLPATFEKLQWVIATLEFYP